MSNHLVRVHLPLRGEEDFDRWVILEDHLDSHVRSAGVGRLDGNEMGDGEFTIWMKGPDGCALAEAVREALRSQRLPPQCYLLVRHDGFDDQNAREEIIPLD